MSNIKLPSYETITTALLECQAPIDAAELHGLIAGIFTTSHNLKASIVSLHNVIPEPNATDDVIQNGIKTLEKLCAITALQLEDHEFDFHLLLPSDDATLAVRTEAVGLWCQGFVSGLGEGGLSLKNKNADELAEIIHDLTAIGRIDTLEIAESEEEEVAHHELVEYVRVVVMTVYSDIAKDKTIIKESKTIH